MHAGLSQQRVGFASHVVCEVSCEASEASGTHQGLAEQLTAAGLCLGQQCVLELRSSPSIGALDTGDNIPTLDEGNSKHSALQLPATVALAQYLANLQEVRTLLPQVYHWTMEAEMQMILHASFAFKLCCTTPCRCMCELGSSQDQLQISSFELKDSCCSYLQSQNVHIGIVGQTVINNSRASSLRSYPLCLSPCLIKTLSAHGQG